MMIEVVESRTQKAPRPHGKEVDWWELGEGVEGVWLGSVKTGPGGTCTSTLHVEGAWRTPLSQATVFPGFTVLTLVERLLFWAW